MQKMFAIYKCRLCGQTYLKTLIPQSKIYESVKTLTKEDTFCDYTSATEISRYDVHMCDADSYGFADFLGVKPELPISLD